MKTLTIGQNIQIARSKGRLKDLGITHKCYVFVSRFDPNSFTAKDVTAYGLQHCSIITKDDNSADLAEKEASVLLEDGEHVMIEDIEYKTKLMGEYSDCIHFIEVGYMAKTTREFYRVKTPLGFADITADTLDEAKAKRREFGKGKGEHKQYWENQMQKCYIVKVTETEERL